MRHRGLLGAVVAGALALPAPGARAGAVDPPPKFDAAALEFFEAKVRPVLVERCLSCHGPEKTKGGLRLDSRAGVLTGGDSGPGATPGKPAESLLVDAVRYGETVQMPPKSRLPEAEVAALTRWVELGLPWPAGSDAAKPAAAAPAFDLKARAAAHWAWRPVQNPPVPPVRMSDWPLGSIDRFVLAALESKGLTPAREADRRVLIRRVTFDLTGLPPTPAEVEAFVADARPDAYERLVDRLLGSPQFGERWGRHWLDLVRYGESRGHEFDPAIPNAWRYRDYVVRALNADVPYDRFLREHVAGDLVETPRVDPVTGANESVLGTGFWFLGEEVHSPVDLAQDEADRLDNRLDVLTKTFLGLTVACARCHDHKFDAISQRDYYALSGFLQSSGYRQVRFAGLARERLAAETLQRQRDESRRRVLALAAAAVRPGLDRLARTLDAARDGDAGGSHDLDPALLAFLTGEVTRGRADANHPLHEPGLWPPDLPGRVVADFGNVENLTGVQDGFAFGLRPVRPGDLWLDRDRVSLETRPAARLDPAFRRLPLTPGTDRDHGRLGSWDRSGQTIRTPEFTLTTGHLRYLARGSGRAYAVMNAHLVIAGPLHGAILTEWTDGDAGWRWVRHDLSAYAGHRLHVEFSPRGAEGMEIARVVEEPPSPRAAGSGVGGEGSLKTARTEGQQPSTENPSPQPSPRKRREGAGRDGRRALRTVSASNPVHSTRTAASALLVEAVQRMAADTLGAADPRVARVADWVVRNLDRLEADGGTARSAIAAEAARLREAEAAAATVVSAPSPTAPAMLDGSPVNARLLIRGQSRQPGPEVPRRYLEAIDGDSPLVAPDGGSGRLVLAERMLDPRSPFPARVIANRVWHHLFGRGIVASVDNLGVLGEPPTHPELLDHLADTFVRDGWSVKRLIRRVVLSRAYRMASRPDPQADTLDPDGRWLHRRTVRRLEAEPVRDAILAVSGRLDTKVGGPSVPVHLTEFLVGRGRPETGPLDGNGRRSVYLAVKRNFLSPMMLAFDAPIPFTTIGRRNVSNVPAQALILMNDPFVAAEARRWAGRVVGSNPDAAGRVDRMYREAYARPATAGEVASALEFVRDQARALGAGADDPRAWADLAHVLINAKEFVFLE